ncbi:MAG TPA: TRAP transporter large permease [Syntrophorhabdaceae bacterium]|nr:TRAP transporter large permease [Syntrophorhabdaceae bacterium]
MSEFAVGCTCLVGLLILFLSGIELAFAMTIMGFVGLAYLRSFDAAVSLLGKDYYSAFSSYTYTVIPLFVFMGQVVYNSGMAGKLYDTVRRYIGHVSGGLALATVVGAAIFKAISGSTLATAATFASVAVPEMDKYGYNRKLSTGVVSSVGTLGWLIPPSGNLIIYGMLTDQSIGRLFLAGVIPGLMMAFFFLLVILGWVKINPSLAQKGPKFTWHERIHGSSVIVWPILIFVAVVGGLLAGIFTPTEAGAAGCITVLILTVLQRDLNFKKFTQSLRESLKMGCMILIIVASSAVLGHLVELAKIPVMMSDFVLGLHLNRFAVLIVIIFVYLLGGSFIEDMAFMILATPIFYPTIIKLGFDPIWFGIIIGVTLMIGVIIPPVAVTVFLVGSITKESVWLIYKGVTPFIIAIVIGMLLLFAFPELATWLPSRMMGS